MEQRAFGSNAGFGLDEELRRIVHAERAQFQYSFLELEKKVFSGIQSTATFVLVLSSVGSVFSCLVTIVMLVGSGAPALFGFVLIVLSALPFAIVGSIARKCRDLVKLRQARISNEAYNTEKEERRISEMSRDLEKIKQRARGIQAGPGSVIILDSTNAVVHSPGAIVSQTAKVGEDVAPALAMLLAYTQQTGNKEAIEAANSIALEAEKKRPDAGKVLGLWTRIVALVPDIAKIAYIVETISKIMAR